MSNLVIPIVIDKKNRRLLKPFNNHPGRYDTLSVIKPSKTPVQWAIRVKVLLQELVSERKRSIYHTHALFLAFGKERDPSNAQLAWLSLPNNNTPKEVKFLGLTPHKVKNPIFLDQIKMCLNKEYGKYIKKYNRLPYIAEFKISRYQEYIIPYNWIDRKKNQLWNRF
ncbi:22718_t:CDS:2 [Cetraspora pellucida]|uniref:22718_t:CDS:1 n=1 Tax=Cetraspora pellucida TaxID=1433469 RepID=A0A9N9A0S3_9GLOM|nr:22718_t:CDS:2 [Cetraspora pellucida]